MDRCVGPADESAWTQVLQSGLRGLAKAPFKRGNSRKAAGQQIRPAWSLRAVGPTDRSRIPERETGCLQTPGSRVCKTLAGTCRRSHRRGRPRSHLKSTQHSLPASLPEAPPQAPPSCCPRPHQLTSLPRGPASFQPQHGAPPNPNRPSTLNGF